MRLSLSSLTIIFVLFCLPVSGQSFFDKEFIDKKDADGQVISRTWILNADILIKEGQDLYRKGQHEEALERFATAAKAVPTSIEANYYAAVLYLKLGMLSEAETQFDKIQELVRFFSGVGKYLYKGSLPKAMRAQQLLEKKMREKSIDQNFADEAARLDEWFNRVEQCQGIVIRPTVASNSEK